MLKNTIVGSTDYNYIISEEKLQEKIVPIEGKEYRLHISNWFPAFAIINFREIDGDVRTSDEVHSFLWEKREKGMSFIPIEVLCKFITHYAGTNISNGLKVVEMKEPTMKKFKAKGWFSKLINKIYQ